MDLKNKVVMVTGSSRGIGKETALLFAKEKCRVVITYNEDKAAAEEVETLCFDEGAQATMLLHLDLTDNASISNAGRSVKENFGVVDILVNNAGVVKNEPLHDQDFGTIDAQINTNLSGLIKMTHQFIDSSLIINVGSGAAKTPYAGLSVYCASKFGVRGFTESIRKEGKDVILVNPGMTATRMTDYTGTSPKKVASVILRAAKKEFDKWEIDVWDVK